MKKDCHQRALFVRFKAKFVLSITSGVFVRWGGRVRQPDAAHFFFPSRVARFGQAYFGDGSRFGQQEAPRHKRSTTMASNALPTKRDRLFAVCDDMCDGLHQLEVTLGIKQNMEALLRPALAAARASEAAFGDARVAKKTANATLTTADAAGKTFIGNARKRLSKFFGESYTTEWGAAGWPDNSTAMPSTQEDRFNLVNSLKTWFTNHAAHESVDMVPRRPSRIPLTPPSVTPAPRWPTRSRWQAPRRMRVTRRRRTCANA